MATEVTQSDGDSDRSDHGIGAVNWLSDSSLAVVEHDILGYKLQFEQLPLSEHLGGTVWDAAVVLAKVFEHVRLFIAEACGQPRHI
jgi:hypothetical protein